MKLIIPLLVSLLICDYAQAEQNNKIDKYLPCYIGNAIVYMEYHKDDQQKVWSDISHSPITQQEMSKEFAATRCKKFYPKINEKSVDGNTIIEGLEDILDQTITNTFDKLYPPTSKEIETEATSLSNKTINYGSRVGMEVDIVSEYGLNSENALIITRHTWNNATKFCKEYLSTTSEKCIREEMAIKLASDIKGNCKTGLFSDFFGFTYRFEGKLLAEKNDPVTPNYAIRLISSEHPHKEGETDTGTILDGSSASGYPVSMQIYATLCPASMK